MLKAITNRLANSSPRSDGEKTSRSSSPRGDAEKTKFVIDDFEMFQTLGTGTFGRVRMVQYKKSGVYYALKSSKKAAIIRMKQVEHVKNEISLLAQINHPNIVNLLGHFQDENRLYLVMEYVQGGELFSHLRNCVRFGDRQGMIYAGEIVLAFNHLHSLNIIYRDLKPENLLITREGRIKVTDFGFAKVVEDRTWTLCGTPEYLAPEIIQSHGHGKGVDWWALGILIHEMLAGYPPFYDENPLGIYQKILDAHVDPPSVIDPKARDLIKKLLVVDRTKRLGCMKGAGKAIQEHKWFASLDWEALGTGKIEAPFIPKVKSNNDTSNFETYPESTDERTASLNAEDRRIFRELDAF